MPANLTILAHFSMSSAIILANSAGVTAWTVKPRSVYLASIAGVARNALISLFSRSTISTGVFLGAPTPIQERIS
jgi:hypothetical protein